MPTSVPCRMGEEELPHVGLAPLLRIWEVSAADPVPKCRS